jgi:hypothetical protein
LVRNILRVTLATTSLACAWPCAALTADYLACSRGESNWEFGPYSPRTLKATTWVGAVVGGASSSLYFEWNGDTSNDLPDKQITAAAARVGLEMRALTASLGAPLDGTVVQPTVTVVSTSTTPDAAPAATPAGYVRAAVYREAPGRGVGDCVHVVAVNAKPSTAKVDFRLMGVAGHANATQPLLWDAQERHPEMTVVHGPGPPGAVKPPQRSPQ